MYLSRLDDDKRDARPDDAALPSSTVGKRTLVEAHASSGLDALPPGGVGKRTLAEAHASSSPDPLPRRSAAEGPPSGPVPAPRPAGEMLERVFGRADAAGGMPGDLRRKMERAYAADFSQIRIHADDAGAARRGALAYAEGEELHFAPGEYAPDSRAGEQLIAHELAHVVQQREGRVAGAHARTAFRVDGALEQEADAMASRAVTGEVVRDRWLAPGAAAGIAQPKLRVLGSKIDAFLQLASVFSGLRLEVDNGKVKSRGDSGTPISQTFRTLLLTIINDRTHDAELNVDVDMLDTQIGAFPHPDDLTAGRVQKIDMGHIAVLTAKDPRVGIQSLAHEIAENYEAHRATVRPGVSRYEPAHDAGILAESDVSTELGKGRRRADCTIDIGDGRTASCFDYGSHYVAIIDKETSIQLHDGIHKKHEIETCGEVPKQQIAQYQIDMTGGTPSQRIPGAELDQLKAHLTSVTIEVSAPELVREVAQRAGIARCRIYGTPSTAAPATITVYRPSSPEILALFIEAGLVKPRKKNTKHALAHDPAPGNNNNDEPPPDDPGAATKRAKSATQDTTSSPPPTAQQT